MNGTTPWRSRWSPGDGVFFNALIVHGSAPNRSPEDRLLNTLAYNVTHAPLAAYRAACPSIIRVDTPGSTAATMTRFPFRHRRRPMYPFEPDLHWSP